MTTFSEQDAKVAGLWGKSGPWKQYPKRMLQMRARGFNLRDNFADILGGLITAEEARDMPEAEWSEVKDDKPTTLKERLAANVRAMPLPEFAKDQTGYVAPEPVTATDGPVFVDMKAEQEAIEYQTHTTEPPENWGGPDPWGESDAEVEEQPA